MVNHEGPFTKVLIVILQFHFKEQFGFAKYYNSVMNTLQKDFQVNIKCTVGLTFRTSEFL